MPPERFVRDPGDAVKLEDLAYSTAERLRISLRASGAHYSAQALQVLVEEMAIRVETAVLSNKGRRIDVEEKWPADWWQALKERWFPRWLLKRYPVKYKSVSVHEHLTHTCPHVGVADYGPHVMFLGGKRDQPPRKYVRLDDDAVNKEGKFREALYKGLRSIQEEKYVRQEECHVRITPRFAGLLSGSRDVKEFWNSSYYCGGGEPYHDNVNSRWGIPKRMYGFDLYVDDGAQDGGVTVIYGKAPPDGTQGAAKR